MTSLFTTITKAGLCLAILGSSAYAGRIWYVRADAAGPNLGTSWLDAFNDLQDALAVGRAGDEIWIAAGTYKPDRGTRDRSATFQLIDGVALYGGFVGDETSIDQRAFDVEGHPIHEAILSGDLAGDDGPRNCEEFTNCCTTHDGAGCDNAACEALVCERDFSFCCDPSTNGDLWQSSCASIAKQECCDLGDANRCENSFHVVTAIGTHTASRLDGLTIYGSYRSVIQDESVFPSAGLLCENECPTIHNCLIRDNTEAGLRNLESGELVITDTRFVDNVGPGLWKTLGSMTVSGCSFIKNQQGINGVVDNSTITNCLFQDQSGIGAFVSGTIKNSVFLRNAKTGLIANGPVATIENCLVADGGGQGISIGGASATVRNCIIRSNFLSGIIERSFEYDHR